MTQKKHFARQAGLSLIEIMVVLIIASALLIMSYSMLDDAARTSLFVEVRNDLPVFAQSAINAIQAETFQADTIFDASAASLGPSYLAIVKLPATYPILPGSRMPLANATTFAEIVPDLAPPANPQYVGNCLLMVRQLTPTPVFMDAAHTLTLLAERYQFEFFYLTQRTNRHFSGPTNTGSTANSLYYIDLMRSRSLLFADATQIANILDTTQRSTVIANLAAWVDPATQVATPIKIAWTSGNPVASAFSNMTTTAPYLTTIAAPQIDMSAISRSARNNTVTLLAGITGGRITGAADYSVAFRPSATTRYQIPDAVPKYAYWNSATPTFPGGLEFLMVGSVGSRRVLTRLVMMASYSAGRLSSKEVTNITATK